MSDAPTVAELLEARADDEHLGLQSADRRWTWSEVLHESRSRARVLERAKSDLGIDGSGQLHVGILLDNVPDYLFWMGAAALTRSVVVGINPTRRGEELARDIRFTECGLIVTDAIGADLLKGLDIGVSAEHVLRIDLPSRTDDDHALPDDLGGSPAPEDLFLLVFTSGTTGSPKAVRCTQGRLGMIATRASEIYGFEREDVCYCPMPLFHGNAIMALWAPALFAGASLAVNGRFSASRFVDDIGEFDATRFTYVGKALAYVLATPERNSDSDNSLKVGFGTEASARDRSEFERRFGCRLVEGYGSSEGGVAITRTPDTPPDALGPAPDGVAVLDPQTGLECARAQISVDGLLRNGDEAIGEIASRSGVYSFEGYFKNPEADTSRITDGWYWTGDLAYRDEAGFVYFAGRNDDWLRVDSENFAAAPIERVLERHPDVVAAAVYAVPDPSSADQVMAAVQLREGANEGAFSSGLADFLSQQADMGTKWTPRFVRITGALPLTATGKITKAGLKKERWTTDDVVIWRSERAATEYKVFGPTDAAAVALDFSRHGRTALIATP